MNEQTNNPNDFSADDERIRAALNPLNDLEPPAGLRQSNRRYLRRYGEKQNPPRTPWWKRRLAIPYPVAAGFILAFGALLFLNTKPQPKNDYAPSVSVPEQTQTPKNNQSTRPHLALQPEASYYESSYYVAGLGAIEKKQGYLFLEEYNHEEYE